MKIPNELIEKLSQHQAQIWQTTTNAVSDAANQSITFSSPLTIAARTGDLYSEMTSPMMVIQFAFSSQPENPQVVLVPQDLVLSLIELVQGTKVNEVDENVVSELRPAMEAIVQGICLGAGSLNNEMVVASGLSIRFQIFAFPHNIQRADEVVRTQIAVSAEDVNGSIIWLADLETAAYVAGIPLPEDEADSPFPSMTFGAGQAASHPKGAQDETYSLDLLLDIPLEVSVELGRVRMLVKDVLDLGNGSIVEIDKAAGEPVDVMVNGRLMAKGEVVVIEDNFGVRITEILNPHERLHRSSEAA